MADAKTLLQKYVSDMVALETHIHQAIDKQVKQKSHEPDVSSKFQAFALTTKQHKEALESRLEQLGGAANSPIKQGVAAVMGVGAGVVDFFRSEDTSKNFRDDFTALNLSLISYIMLHTTALSMHDQVTADMAARHAKDNAEFVMWIQKIVPTIVVNELRDNHDVVLDNSAAEASRQLIKDIWK
jgi:ferritin-like metal-binding protein YciE